METKAVKATLKRWGNAKTFCAARMREAEEYKDLLESARGLRAVTVDGMPRGNQKSDPTQTAAAEAMRIEMEYNEVLVRIRHDIEDELTFAEGITKAVNQLPFRHREIIERRYRLGDSARRVGYAMGYTERSINRYEKEALEILGERLK